MQAITLRQLVGRSEKGLLSHDEILHHKERYKTAVAKRDQATLDSIQRLIGEEFVRVVRGSRTMPESVRSEIASTYQSLVLMPQLSVPLTRGIIDILEAKTMRVRSSERQTDIASVARRLRGELQAGVKGLKYDVSNTLRNIADLTGRMEQYLPTGIAPNILQRMKRRLPGLKTTALLALLFAAYTGLPTIAYFGSRGLGRGIAEPFAKEWTPERVAETIKAMKPDKLREIVGTLLAASREADKVKARLIVELEESAKKHRDKGEEAKAKQDEKTIDVLQMNAIADVIGDLSDDVLRILSEDKMVVGALAKGITEGVIDQISLMPLLKSKLPTWLGGTKKKSPPPEKGKKGE